MSIGYQVDQGVATLTINRPEKKNALSGEMYEALRLRTCSRRRTTRASAS